MIEEIGGDFMQWLRGFYFVAKRRSVTIAALEMGRNQPAISHQIKCLENEFGVTLFDRSSRKMELTPEGQVLLEKTISIFETIKEMKSEISKSHFQHKGKIILATTHAIIHYFLPPFISSFSHANPKVVFKIEGGGLEMILDKVESAETDFGIANLNTVPETMIYSELFETGLVLIAPKNNPFFKNTQPTLEQISEVPFIFFPHSSTITPLIEKTFSDHGLKLNVILILNNFQSVKKYVSQGIGVSILDDYTLSEEDRDILDIFQLDNFFRKRKYGLIVRRKKYLSPAVKAFIRTIKPDICLKSDLPL